MDLSSIFCFIFFFLVHELRWVGERIYNWAISYLVCWQRALDVGWEIGGIRVPEMSVLVFFPLTQCKIFTFVVVSVVAQMGFGLATGPLPPTLDRPWPSLLGLWSLSSAGMRFVRVPKTFNHLDVFGFCVRVVAYSIGRPHSLWSPEPLKTDD